MHLWKSNFETIEFQMKKRYFLFQIYTDRASPIPASFPFFDPTLFQSCAPTISLMFFFPADLQPDSPIHNWGLRSWTQGGQQRQE